MDINALYQLIDRQFGDLGPAAVQTMLGIVLAESGGDPGAYNGADPAGGSFGLAQINGVHGYDPRALMDPEQNIAAARQVWDAQGPAAWSTYSNGDAFALLGGDPMATSAPASMVGPSPGQLPDAPPQTTPAAPPPPTFDFGGGSKPKAPLRINGLDINAAAQLAAAQGYTGTGQGEAFGSLWRGPDGRPVTLESIVKQQTSAPSGGGATGSPTARIVNPQTGTYWTFNPQSRQYEDSHIPAQLSRAGATSDPNNQYTQAQIASLRGDLAIRQQNEAFLERKATFEATAGLARDAAQTRAQLLQVRTQIAAQQAEIATNIGRLAANPGDVGEAAAYSLGASGQQFGGEGSGLTGQDFRSQRSLQPLQSLLDSRESLFGLSKNVDQAQQQADADYGNARSQLGALMPADVGMGQPAPVPGTPQPTAPAAGAPPQDPVALLTQILAPQLPVTDEAPNVGTGLDLSGAITGALPQKANGGTQSGAYISGERGPEINIPLDDGKAVVLNSEQAKALGINLDKLAKMATGGIFSVGAPSQDVSGAHDLLASALTRALAGTPWTPQNLPGPVFASAPGTSTLVRQLLGSLNSLGRGINPQYFQEQAQQLAPAGVNEAAVRRTA